MNTSTGCFCIPKARYSRHRGRGRWIPLVHGLTRAAGFRDQAEILINARAAADRVGATPMDRPEWGACTRVTVTSISR